jgi:DNA-binding IscR family transcriptional regulator
VTSDVIARMLNANPVVMRRTMAGLREQGHVRSEKGHGGGWKLARNLAEISLLDVYQALGEPPLFALGLAKDHPRCLVEQAANAALEGALGEARLLLLNRLSTITLADLSRSFGARLKHSRKASAARQSS